MLIKRGFALALTALCLLSGAAQGSAEGTGIVAQSSCSIVQSGDYYLVYCYAQVHNASDEVICLERGSFELYSEEQVLSTTEIDRLWPNTLGPGEDGYLFDIVSFEPTESGVFVPQVTGLDYQIDYMSVSSEYASTALDVSSQLELQQNGVLSVLCTITNPTAVDAYDATITFGLYTEGGAMIYADGKMLQDVGIPAGQSVLVRFDVDDAFVQQWSSYNAMPSEARVSATFRDVDD